MPLYEYHCESCDRDFERRRPFKEADAPIQCPECQGAQVTRKVSLFFAITKNSSSASTFSGGGCCGSGGACACSSHSMN